MKCECTGESAAAIGANAVSARATATELWPAATALMAGARTAGFRLAVAADFLFQSVPRGGRAAVGKTCGAAKPPVPALESEDPCSTPNEHNLDETQEVVENTSLIGQILGKAVYDVQELDAIMNNKSSRQPEKLCAWQSATGVDLAPQREKKPDAGSRGTPAKPQ